MGYCITQGETEFYIRKENKAEALAAIKDAVTNSKNGFRFADDAALLGAKTLEDALEAWSWDPEVDGHGNIIDINHSGQKLGDDAQLFSMIGPFVEERSFIQVAGEDFQIWRWVFENETMREISPSWNT